MRQRPISIVVLLAAAAVACGGGGSDSSSGGVIVDPPTDPINDSGGSTSLAAGFTAEEQQPGSGSVALSLSSVSGNLVTIRVRVVGVNDVYGAGFDLPYEAAHVDYVGWSAGNLLEVGGNAPIYTVAAQDGKLVVGASRSGPVGGVDVSSRYLIELTFRVRDAGSWAVGLENGFLLDPGPPAPTAIPGIAWFGGHLWAN